MYKISQFIRNSKETEKIGHELPIPYDRIQKVYAYSFKIQPLQENTFSSNLNHKSIKFKFENECVERKKIDTFFNK